jgi:hypothetical protein
MKTKTLITMAVASTFGWSAAAFAVASHEVITPFSPNESGEQIFVYQEGFGSTDHMASIGSISDEAGGTLSGSVSDEGSGESLALDDEGVSTDESLAFGDEGLTSDESLALADEGLTDESLALADEGLTMDESLALADEGIYSDYYLVSWTPMAVDTWDFYVIDIDATSDQVATLDLSAFPSESSEEASG